MKKSNFLILIAILISACSSTAPSPSPTITHCDYDALDKYFTWFYIDIYGLVNEKDDLSVENHIEKLKEIRRKFVEQKNPACAEAIYKNGIIWLDKTTEIYLAIKSGESWESVEKIINEGSEMIQNIFTDVNKLARCSLNQNCKP